MSAETTAKPYPLKGKRGTGRRKEAIACVRLLPGKGTVLINGLTMTQYLGPRPALHVPVLQPLVAIDSQTRFDVLIKTIGGGKVGQAIAIRMGIARALAEMSDEYKQVMRAEGFLTRDARVKERKKYGRKKARKRFQFSKR
jgi:small subunit ribosomal protein S9